ncbi:ankyrin repeat-containing protein NPR4-like [Hevea brasiliensis]|uniref:ankyrin repeat-containing protein NPR4-like n=1 Tax=Hevea brasiliensis TaxID=3981 RepID=UPI0025D8346A|nr:ankyrin repeat-containing protein NPR4-like [Hevea brasiliensis]
MESSNTTRNFTPIDACLWEAAAKGNLDPFKESDVPLDCLLTPNKNTILHIHLTSRSERKIEFIKGVLDIRLSLLWKVNDHGDTPLHIAARYGHVDAARELIAKASADGDKDIESGKQPRVKVLEMLRMKNKNNDTALHEATRNRSLHEARQKRRLGVVKEILRNEEPDDEYKYSANDCGETPLYLAADNGCGEIVLELLGSPKLKSLAYDGPNGKTALHAAAMNWNIRRVTIIEKLLAKWSSLAKNIDEEGWTPLHYAAYKHRTSVVKRLLVEDESCAYVADKKWKRTALHIAACRGFEDTVETIISKCPSCCELTDIRGWNVLHYAVISKNDEVIKAVLRQGSSFIYLLDGKDVKGNTPIHLYRAYHPEFCVPSFIKEGETEENQKGEGDAEMFKFWRKLDHKIQFSGSLSSKKKENLKLMKDLGTGPLGKIDPQKEFLKEKEEKRKKYMAKKFEQVKESHLVAAILVATVAFAAAFTSPGGYISDENNLKKGTAILSRNPAFKLFFISDTIAMVFSACSVFAHIMLGILGYQERYYWLIRYAFNFLFYAMVAMMITFVAGTYAFLSHSFGIVICVIGLFFFLFLFYSITRVTWNLFSPNNDGDVLSNDFWKDKDDYGNNNRVKFKDEIKILSWTTGVVFWLGIFFIVFDFGAQQLIKKLRESLKK